MSVLEEVATYLSSLGTVGTYKGAGVSGGTLFVPELPATPNACGAVKEAGGSAPDRGFGSVVPRFENAAIQLLFRGEPYDYATPREKARLAWLAMLAILPDQELSGTTYVWIRALQQPFPLKKDDLHRHYVACNYLIQKEPS